MKTPRDLADAMGNRKTGRIIRETLRMPPAEARRHAKLMFEKFPSATYLTEIENWRLTMSGTVEWTVKRLEKPLDEAN